jgi:hypothetical protein
LMKAENCSGVSPTGMKASSLMRFCTSGSARLCVALRARRRRDALP